MPNDTSELSPHNGSRSKRSLNSAVSPSHAHGHGKHRPIRIIKDAIVEGATITDAVISQAIITGGTLSGDFECDGVTMTNCTVHANSISGGLSISYSTLYMRY